MTKNNSKKNKPEYSLPTKITFRLHTYDILPLEEEENSTSIIFGKCDNANSIIYIKQGLSVSQWINTLFHEIIHAVLFISVGSCNLTEESVCCIMSNAIMELLIENKSLIELLKYLEDDNKRLNK